MPVHELYEQITQVSRLLLDFGDPYCTFPLSSSLTIGQLDLSFFSPKPHMLHYNHHQANPDIPLDVVELIMKELAKDDDMETLQSCSLACRHFRSICQQHIFAAIKLDFSKRPFKNPLASRFRRLVDRNPSIARYVRSLDYVELFDSKRGAPVLRRFNHVNSFTFGFNNFDPLFPPRQDWDRMSMSLKTSLCCFIHANNIVELHLFNIENLPMSLLLHFPALSLLDIYQVNVVDSSLPVTFPGKEVTPRLSSLTVRAGTLLTVWDLLGSESGSIIDLRQLKELSVCTQEELGAMEIIHYILRTTENIETVRLAGTLVSFALPMSSLSSLPFLGHSPALTCLGNIASALSPGSLKTLKLIQFSPMLDSADEDPYLDLTRELEAISGRNVLEEIIIDIDIETDDTCTTDPTKWAQLDDILSMANGFPFLRRVDVKVTSWCYCGLGHKEFLEKMWDIGQNEFSRLVATKQVEFTFDVQVELI